MQTTFEQAVEIVRELSPDERKKLAQWLETELAEPVLDESSKQEIYKRRMRWLKDNRAQYGGQYVVLDGDRLLGVAQSYPEGKKIAKEYGVPEAFVNYLSCPDEEGFYGNQ